MDFLILCLSLLVLFCLYSMCSFFVMESFFPWFPNYLSLLTLDKMEILAKSKLTIKCSKFILINISFRFHLLVKLNIITYVHSFYSVNIYNFSICSITIRDLTIKLFFNLKPNIFYKSLK